MHYRDYYTWGNVHQRAYVVVGKIYGLADVGEGIIGTSRRLFGGFAYD